MRQGRQDGLERPDLVAEALQRLAEIGHEAADLGAPRAGQDDDDRRRFLAPPRLLRVGTQFAEPLDQRMADIDARRAADPD